jgi:predicted  nucleic acid-binding Zn-ribbon protein
MNEQLSQRMTENFVARMSHMVVDAERRAVEAETKVEYLEENFREMNAHYETEMAALRETIHRLQQAELPLDDQPASDAGLPVE